MIYLVLNLYALIDGVCDAILYSRKGADSFKWNEHIVLVIRRCLVGLLVLLGVQAPYTDILIQLCCYVLSFSFFHNGAYYITRELINGKGLLWYYWFHDSTTSTAKLEFNYLFRTLLFLISLICLTTYYIYQ